MEIMQIVKQFLYGKWTVLTVMTLFFLNFSRVLGARIMRTGIMRTYLRSTREKFTFFSVNTVHCPEKQNTDIQIIQMYLYVYYGWGWVEDVSQIIHAYRVRAVRMIVFYFNLHPSPPFFYNSYP